MLKDKPLNKGRLLYLLPLIPFVCFAVFCPVNITNDSAQYIAFHIHRDPLYCLFLGLMRLLVPGEGDAYLSVAVWVQNILAWVSVVILTDTVHRIYRTGRLMTVCICFFTMAPHLMTPLAAQSGLVLSNSIMSEAVTLPLFYFFGAAMILMMERGKRGDAWGPLILAFLLSTARGQMQVCIIVWAVVRIAGIIRKHEKVLAGVAITLAAFVAAFGLRTLGTDTYNLIFNNYFHGTTFSEVSMLTNVLYASDADAVEYIEDPEAARFFSMTMEEMEKQELGYRYCEDGILARGADIENEHDTIKFKCVDEFWRPVHDEENPAYRDDYELETIEQDRIAGIILKAILPHCLGRWIYGYLALCIYGFVRTVAFMNPVFCVYAVILYLFLVGDLIREMIMNHTITGTPGIRLGLFTLLSVCANVCGTATVIMCLSRYMIYVMPFVYITLILAVRRLVTGRGKCYDNPAESLPEEEKK